MDMADRASMQPQRISKVDPLMGYDIAREYELIQKGESDLHTRIQGMIVARAERGA